MTDLDARLAVAVIGTYVVIDFGTHEAAMAGIERVRVLDAAAVLEISASSDIAHMEDAA